MIRRHIQHAGVLAALLAPTTMSAQAGAVRAPSACTYETCALRVEPALFFPSRLVRGRSSEEVSKLGTFGGGVETLLAGPDSAAAYGRRYVTDIKTSSTLALIGTAALVAALIRANNTEGDDAAAVTLAATAVGFTVVSIPFSVRAARSLSRAVWWYNSALPTH